MRRCRRPGALTGSASLRRVRGSADVSAPTGGGRIEAEGVGASVGLAWKSEGGFHLAGRASATRYEADLRADGRGRLAPDVRATVRSFGVEAGWRFAAGESAHLTPRAWLVRSELSMDGFSDTAGTRVSLEASRSLAGLGVVAETVRAWDGGARTLALSGHLGVERALGDAETAAEVSGESPRLGGRPDAAGAGPRRHLALGPLVAGGRGRRRRPGLRRPRLHRGPSPRNPVLDA